MKKKIILLPLHCICMPRSRIISKISMLCCCCYYYDFIRNHMFFIRIKLPIWCFKKCLYLALSLSFSCAHTHTCTFFLPLGVRACVCACAYALAYSMGYHIQSQCTFLGITDCVSSLHKIVYLPMLVLVCVCAYSNSHNSKIFK